MEYLTRENVITGVCVIVAVAAFYGLAAYTTVGDEIRFAMLILIGVLLPFLLTKGYSS